VIWGAIIGGLAGTIVLTTMLRAPSELGLTRMDIPFLLGTAVTADRVRAKAIGYALHFVFGLLFALAYYAIFLVIGRSGFLLGAGFGRSMPSSPAAHSSTSSCRWRTHAWAPVSMPPVHRRCSSRPAS